VCRIFVIREITNVGSPFFRAFPSDHIPKAMKDVSVLFFIHIFTFSDELITDSGLALKMLIIPANSVNFLKNDTIVFLSHD
jgi:hypothetical protein